MIAKNPSVSALRQAQGGELVEPQTEPPPLAAVSALTELRRAKGEEFK